MTIFAVVKETNDMAMEQKELSVNIDYLIENGLVNYTDGDMVLTAIPTVRRWRAPSDWRW